MIISGIFEVRKIYSQAAERGWVLPCFCSENLLTTEAILTAASEYGKEKNIEHVPVIVAITCNYSHRSQAPLYTQTKDGETGLRLFYNDLRILTENGGPFDHLHVMVHLDHIQYDRNSSLLESDLSMYSSIMYDASALPFDENIKLTAEFVKEKADEIYIEGACDEIANAVDGEHNEITTAENAYRYFNETGVDMIVANMGTEHRAQGKQLRYHGEAARKIKEKIGNKIVLHGASSVTNDQVKNLFDDGVCKVNIWTALERDSTPVLFADMIRNASKTAGPETVAKLVEEGYLTDKCVTGEKISITNFTLTYRNAVVFNEMKRIIREYFDLWYV